MLRTCQLTSKLLTPLMLSFVLAGGLRAAETPDQGAEDKLAECILEATGVRGGLIVHIGGAGELTAALHAGDGYLVHALDADADNVAKAREQIRSLGLCGEVSVEQWTGNSLPYVDNLVNLLVAEDPGRVSIDEVVRVLAPRGVALIAEAGQPGPGARPDTVRIGGHTWRKIVKPWPEEIDEWTHYLHGPDNNAVAQDTAVGPPKHFQWIGHPRWLRHHDHLSGLSAMVSTGGRIFYIIDLGPRWSVQMPPKWTLVARDAFNGVILWRRPIPTWHPHLWPLKRGPAQLMRRLVAEGETVYVTLGADAPVTALDAATGNTIRTYADTEGAEEMILAGGVLYVLVNPRRDAYKDIPRDSVEAVRRAGRTWNWDEQPRRIAAFDAGTGKMLWNKESRVAPNTLASAGSRLYFHDGDKILCLDVKTGRQVWASKPIPRWKPMHVLFGPTLVVYRDVVLFAGGENLDPQRGGEDTMTCVSAETGETLWTAPHPPSGYASAEDLFVIDNLVWCGVTSLPRHSGVFTGRDVHTGEVRREFPPDDWPHMPHHRCHRAKATSKYILTSRTGIEFVDLQSEHWTAHHWARGSCNYGIMACNGLVYAPPHSCACYLLAKLNAFNALAPARKEDGKKHKPAERPRLERGPAYDELSSRLPASPAPFSDDWPTFRHDVARSGTTKTSVPAELKQLWQADIGGELSAVVVADNRAFVAAVDRHTVHAVDAASGKELWRFAAGGRVDSPPTFWRGRVLFGSADGYVYCLRAADGALAWRFRAAPADRRLTAYEQVESVWPVHGSVLVLDSGQAAGPAGKRGLDGIVYCVAGRTMWLDGGLRLLRLDARTGKKLSETVLDDKYPGTDDNLQKDIEWPNLPVALPDVLSSDGRYVYMRSQPFGLDGKRPEVITPRNYDQQRGATTHLFSPTGFLDDAWWHRSYWMLGRSYISAAGGWYLATYQAPAGRILAVDENTVYGFGRVPLRFVGTPNLYHLFACGKEPKLINPNPKRPPRKRGARVYGPVIRTRLDYQWSESLPLLVRSMVVAGERLFVAGPPAVADEWDVYLRYGDADVQAKMADHAAAFEGRKGAFVMAVSKTDGKKLGAYHLDSPPVFDGMAAAGRRMFLATTDGKLLCLGAGDGKPLKAAPKVQPGPVPTARPGIVETKSHPDFDHLKTISITSSDIGYRMRTAPREVGMALKKLPAPLTKRATLRVKVRPTPGAASPDKPGNGFLVFGDAPDDARLVKCGFRIAGKSLHVVEGPLLKGRAKGKRLDVKADEVAELLVTVDLGSQKVSVTMHGETVEAPLARRLDGLTWFGCCLTSVTTDFSPIEITGQ